VGQQDGVKVMPDFRCRK